MTNILLQTTQLKGARFLAQLHYESFTEGVWSLSQIEDSLALPTTRGWVASVHHKPVGFILCQVTPPQSEVLTFCVHPNARRQGIAEQMLRKAIKSNRGEGCDSLLLEVAADNHAAPGLYEKCGFQQTGQRRHYYKRDTTMVDALLFTLSIPPLS